MQSLKLYQMQILFCYSPLIELNYISSCRSLSLQLRNGIHHSHVQIQTVVNQTAKGTVSSILKDFIESNSDSNNARPIKYTNFVVIVWKRNVELVPCHRLLIKVARKQEKTTARLAFEILSGIVIL